VNNVQCDTAVSAFIRFENNYHGSRGGHYPTLFNHFYIQNVACTYAGEVGIYAVGVAKNPLKNINLRNVTVFNTPKDQIMDNADNLTYENVLINSVRLEQPVNTGAITLHTD
jgi:hypothetical protein